MRQLVVLAFLACSVPSTWAGTYLTCKSDETSVKTAYITDSSGKFTDCAQLIGAFVDTYQDEYRNECQRWMSGALPTSVSSAYVTECTKQSDGSLRYRSEVCCPGALTVTRCFTCTKQSSHYACDYQGTVETCAAGEICSTTFDYFGSDGQYCSRQISKGCLAKNTCDAHVAANPHTCLNYVDQPQCSYCYDNSLGNWEGSESNTYKYCGPKATTPTTACDGVSCGYGSCQLDSTKQNGYFCQCYPYSWNDASGKCPKTYCNNSTKCLNNGVCSNTYSAPFYTCCCQPKFFGQTCDQAVPSCTNQPSYCQNGGSCLDYGTTGLRCNCPTGWLGQNCEIKSDITCLNPAGYYKSGRYLSQSYSSSYTCSNMGGWSFSSFSSTCNQLMKRSDGPLFQNGVHGFVDDFEYNGLQTCDAGDRCIWYKRQFCCPTCMSAPCLNGGWCVQKADHDFVCKCRFGFEGRSCENKVAMCITSGDPHYETFDGEMIHFQGTCQYKMAAPSITNTGLPDFQVLTKNENRNGKTDIAYPKYLEVVVYGKRIRLDSGKKAFIDGVEVFPDITFPGGRVTLNGEFLRVETNFSLVVEFDGAWMGLIKLPAAYAGKIGGLCGNYDGDISNDMMTSDGLDVSGQTNKYSELGNSFYIGDTTDPNCPKLDLPDPIWTPEDETLAKSDDYCGPINKATGPFRSCVVAESQTAKAYFDNCVYDVAVDVDKARSCASVEAFVTLCKQKGLPPTSTWRADVKCPMTCPAGLVYKALTSACHSTCERPLAETECGLPDAESCKCPDDTVLHLGACQDRSVCGCLDSEKVRHQITDKWSSLDCGKEFTCAIATAGGWGEITENSASCKAGYECKVNSGIASCVSTVTNGGWGPWQQWTLCTSPCGEGDQTHSRACDSPPPSSGGAPCSGPATETRSCLSVCPKFDPEDCQSCDLTRNPAGYLPDPCSCLNYRQCYRYQGQWRAYQRLCPPCTRWSASDLTCINDPTVTDRSSCVSQVAPPDPVVSSGGTCQRDGQTFKVVPGDTTKYIWPVMGTDYVMSCPAGTGFDVLECTCVFGSVVVNEPRRVFLLSFDQSYETVGGVWVHPVNMGRQPGGVRGNCGDFTGLDSRIEIPYFTNNAFSEFTFSLWYRRPNGPDNDAQGLVYNGDCDDDGSIQIISEGQNKIKAGILANVDLRNGQLNFDQAIRDKWHHVAFVYDGQTAKLFVNGSQIKSSPVTGATKKNYCPLVLGYMFSASDGYFKGQMDEVSFYKTALSVDDINDLYAGKEVL